jgi:hypothetical protein
MNQIPDIIYNPFSDLFYKELDIFYKIKVDDDLREFISIIFRTIILECTDIRDSLDETIY